MYNPINLRRFLMVCLVVMIGRDEMILQIRLFGLESRVGTEVSQYCPQLSIKIGGVKDDVMGRPCSI